MTIKEIAQLAGVSASTVSKIINEKDDSINPETRSRVLTIVKKYNYVPYANIKVPSSSKTFIIGVLRRCDNCQDRLVSGILQTAQAHGYNILLFDSANSYDEELKHITALCRSKVDGLIWEPVGVNSLQSGHYLAECSIPVCYVNTPHVPSACNIDFRNMGYELAEKMIGFGHKRIACLLDKELLSSQTMLEGIQKCLYDHHIMLPDKMCFYSSDEKHFQELLDGKYSAVISSSYPAALAFYHQLKNIHYDIPADISLCSLRDDCQHEPSFPNITALEIPYRSLGAYITESIIKNIERDKPVTPESFTPSYHILSSDTIDVPAASRTRSILITGSIYMDILLTAESLPQDGKSVSIINSTSCLGGKGSNQAIGSARLGCKVSLLGKIGKDSDARFIYDALQKEHITTSSISCSSDVPTGKAYIYTSLDGKTATAFLHGANNSLSVSDIQKQEHLFKDAHISVLSAGISSDAVWETLKLSKKHGLYTIFFPHTLRSIPEEFIPYIDLLVCGKQELENLCPEETDYDEQAEFFYAQGLKTLLLIAKPEELYFKASDIEKRFHIDSADAASVALGIDAFISALSAYLLRGFPLEQAARIAQYAYSLSNTRKKSTGILPDRLSLETYIARMEPSLLEIH